MTTRPTTTTDALDLALRRANLAELDEQIGPEAFGAYIDALHETLDTATQDILEWWRHQPPEVVEAMIEALRNAAHRTASRGRKTKPAEPGSASSRNSSSSVSPSPVSPATKTKSATD